MVVLRSTAVGELVRNLVRRATILRLQHRMLKKNQDLISSKIHNAAAPHIFEAKLCPVCHGTGGSNNSLCATCEGMGRL